MNRNVIQRANLLSDFDRVDEVSVQPIRELDKTCGHLGKARLGQKRTSDYLRPCRRTLSKLTGCFLPSRFVMNIAQEFGAICRDSLISGCPAQVVYARSWWYLPQSLLSLN